MKLRDLSVCKKLILSNMMIAIPVFIIIAMVGSNILVFLYLREPEAVRDTVWGQDTAFTLDCILFHAARKAAFLCLFICSLSFV